MKKIIVSISVLTLVLLLVGCNGIKPNTDDTIPTPPETNEPTIEQTSDSNLEETDTHSNENNDTTEETFEDIYHKAEWVYSLFTRYGKLTYTENEILHNNERYREVKMSEFDTLDELRALCLLYFNQNVTRVLMNTRAETDCPLYIEQDGKLYRFSRYTAPYAYDAPYNYTFDLQTDDGGHNYANIYATMDSNGQQLPCQTYCGYEIGETGEIIFVRFDLMAHSFFKQYRVIEITPDLEPLTNGGAWTCVAIYGENGNTGSGWGGKIQASEDGIVYFVFGSTRGKYDNSIERYVTFKVTITNGSIVSCEEAENTIAEFLSGSASVYKGDVFAQENVKVMTKARYTTDSYNAYLIVYTVQIEGNEISIYAFADGTDMGGQYTGTFEYDKENGEMILHLTLHYFRDDNGPNEKDVGEVRGKLYESNGLVAFVCTDAGEVSIDEGMPLIFVKDYDKESQIELDDVIKAYQTASEAAAWFRIASLLEDGSQGPVDMSTQVVYNDFSYFRVMQYNSYSEFIDYLGTLFSDELIESFLSYNGTMYINHNGYLYGRFGMRGTNIFIGAESYEIEYVNSKKVHLLVKVDVMDEDLSTVKEYKTVIFPYENIGEKWVFTDFPEIR